MTIFAKSFISDNWQNSEFASKASNNLCEKLHLRCLTGFWIYFCSHYSYKRTVSHTGTGTQPRFFNWLPVFLEKVQTTSTNQNFIICCQYFSCYHFLFPLWHCSHMSLSSLSLLTYLWFKFLCFLFCGALGLLLCLKSKMGDS